MLRKCLYRRPLRLIDQFLNILLLSRCFMSTETVWLIRDGRMEVGGKREIIYLSLHCHHQNDPLHLDGQ